MCVLTVLAELNRQSRRHLSSKHLWLPRRSHLRCCLLFFFFQAEDGIRDVAVTGVQTCALPISCATAEPSSAQVEYIYEQPAEQLLDRLLPRYVESQVQRAMLESSAAEHAARMTAMESATKNAGDVIEALTLHMNKVRQAAITKEIIEIVSGASSTA